MNIVHLVSNKVWGGGERYALDLASASRDAGHNVSVFVKKNTPAVEIFASKGLLAGTMRLGGALDIFTPIRLAKRLDALAKPVIVHVHNFRDAQTAVNARNLCKDRDGIKIVCTRHLIRPAKTDSSHTALYRALDAIIFVSQAARNAFLSSGVDVDCSRLHVVHNSIIPENVTPRENGGDASDGDKVKLLFAGRIVPEKGLDVLVKALELLKDDSRWSLEVCGTGKSRDVMPIVKLSRGLGIADRISWPGSVDNVQQHIADSDVVIMPSISPESFGLVILEAASLGVPVIASNNGAQPEIISNGVDGMLVASGDYEALAQAIRTLIDDPDRRKAMGRAALATFNERFSYDKFFKQITDIYNGLTV